MSDNKSRAIGRPKRVPLHAQRVLDVDNKDPNFEYRVVNELPGRVEKFIKAGWEPVSGDVSTSDASRVQDASQLGSVTRRVVNKSSRAEVQTAVLMRIPKEYYEEDQKEKQRKVDEIEQSYDPTKADDVHGYATKMDKKYN